MADPQPFHDKLQKLRPDDTLKPDTVFVAILLHDFSPTDDLVQANVLWVKCPKHKDVSALKKAYVKQHPYEVCLRHDFKVIDDRTLLQSLTRRSNDFIALEAVKITDLARRNALLASQRKPLQDVTNHARQTPVSHLKGRDTKGHDIPITTQPATLSNTPSPATSVQNIYHADPLMTREDIDGWTDFAYERREHRERSNLSYPHRPLTDLAIKEGDKAIEAEWHTLNPGQKSFFVGRSKKLLTTCQNNTYHHRAFWSFYYDVYFERKNRMNVDPHADFRSTEKFAEEMISAWGLKSTPSRIQYIDRIFKATHRNPVPVVTRRTPEAPNSNAPTPQATSTPAVEDQSRDECLPGIVKDEAPEPTSSTPTSQENAKLGQDDAAVRLNMTELFSGRTPEQLEKSVEKGVEMLQQIRQTLESQPSQDARQWLQTIENVQKQAVRTKTVVGVVGATGAGKSSVINAMLDEERLVPTNCMRACTAVVTEISYNHEEVRYRAEIEFIARQDWAKELKVLFQDLIDGSGEVSRECTNEDSDAGIAYAKIRAVYPRLTKEDMKNATVEYLMQHGNVNCLGTERTFESDDPLVFYKDLQHYVDSKEKSTSKDKLDKEKKTREIEFWPLIKVVRLYVKAPALATGAVIVDLPGVHDSNQARAAVAQNYMKACTGLWIVAPITRAVDDKSAKTLLGDSFKRQLKMDGGYSSVTFICSKTDDISLTEATDSLGLEEEMGPLYAKSDELRKAKKALQKKMADLKETKGDISAAMESADEELEVWEKLQEQQSDGKTVYKPKPQSESRKRKLNAKQSSPRKKSKYTEPETDDDFIDDASDAASDAGSDYADSETNDRGEPLTEDDIAVKIAELRATKKEGRREKLQIEDQIKAVRKEIQELDPEQEAIDAQISAKCISGRNEYSRTAIQKDFAAGIKELDQELAEEEDAANFNPEVDARDYDEVANNLPVFCVSSRAYQKLMGRLRKDKAVPGFENVDETEIPQLQAHCRKLTEAGREAACKRFLTNLTQLLNSLCLWSSNDGSGRNLTDAQLKREAKVLSDKLDKLDFALEKSVKSIIEDLANEIQDSIYDTFPTAITSAKSQANDIARKWGSPVNRDNRAEGGLYWATYKAVVRRDGCFTNAQGCHNFNEQLTEPILRHVTSPWEKVFTRRLQTVLSGLSLKGSTLLTTFHNEVETRAVKNGASIAAFQMLKQQLPVYKETLKDASLTVKNEITTKQRDINREFVPKITDNMLSVYNDCLMESGPGQYNRMKGHMDRHVENAKHSMYEESSEGVKDKLTDMLKEAKKSLLDKTDEIFMAVKRDYTGVIVGQDDGKQASLLPREQRTMRKAVLHIVDGAELAFKRAVGLEPEEEIPEESKEEEAVDGQDVNKESQSEAGAEETAEPMPSTDADGPAAKNSYEAPQDVNEPSAKDSTAESLSTESMPAEAVPTEEDLLAAFLRPNKVLQESLKAEGEGRATDSRQESANAPSSKNLETALDLPSDVPMNDVPAPALPTALAPVDNINAVQPAAQDEGSKAKDSDLPETEFFDTYSSQDQGSDSENDGADGDTDDDASTASSPGSWTFM